MSKALPRYELSLTDANDDRDEEVNTEDDDCVFPLYPCPPEWFARVVSCVWSTYVTTVFSRVLRFDWITLCKCEPI